jgi:hypothetical protein
MKNQLLTYLVLLAIVDVVIPVPVLALILLYVVWKRPRWFADMFHDLYGPGA